MAARVGTGTTGTGDGGDTTIVFTAANHTAGNLLVAHFKWETGGLTLSSVADTAGSSWSIIAQDTHNTGGEPGAALAYAANTPGHATNVVTGTFSGAATWRRGICEEFSGIATSSALDQSAQLNEGAGAGDYTTAAITTTTTGLVFLGISDFNALSGHSGTPGNPDFSIGATLSDTFIAYLISASAQTVTPGASATGVTRWVAIAQAFKDASGAANNQLAWVVA